MPNFSATLLLTRPMDGSRRFAEQIAADLPQGVDLLFSPVLDIQPTREGVDLNRFSGVIFTSARAVAYAGSPTSVPVYCVGAETQRHAEAAGWSVRCTKQNAESLFLALTNEKPPTPLVHLAGRYRRGALAERLTAAGLATRECVLYEQFAVPLSEQARAVLHGAAPVIVPLFSPRSAQIFADQFEGTAPLYLIAISEAALRPLDELKASEVVVALEPTAAGMRAQITETLRRVEESGTPL